MLVDAVSLLTLLPAGLLCAHPRGAEATAGQISPQGREGAEGGTRGEGNVIGELMRGKRKRDEQLPEGPGFAEGGVLSGFLGHCSGSQGSPREVVRKDCPQSSALVWAGFSGGCTVGC